MRNYALEIAIRQINKTQEEVRDYLDLKYAYLRGTDLEGANLSGANLTEANLTEANLNQVDLSFADLSFADLNHASLSGADLRWSDISGADLSGANLLGVKLTGTNLTGTCIQTTFDGVVPSTDLSLFATYEEDSDFVVGYRTSDSILVGEQTYEIGKEYCAPYFFVDTRTECGLGLYLYPTIEQAKELADHYGYNVIKVIAMRKETMKAGSKYRTKRFLVLETV